jgi:DNA-directed RNA polymerase subunit K/omega
MGFENLDVESFAQKVGGRTLATTLVQKRIRELERGWPALVPVGGQELIQVALEEFREDKIWLVSGAEADKLRDARMIEERERARALEAARRAAEEAAGLASGGQKSALGGVAGIGRPAAPPA